MGNTVRRPRKRPREDSCAWKTFGWLLRRAAALASYEEFREDPADHSARKWFCTVGAAQLARYHDKLRERHPPAVITRVFRG